jgi:lipopolysaccharide transport system ATP-binding protein
MSEAIITVENLGKKYCISHQGGKQRYTTLRDVIAQKTKGLFKKLKSVNLKSANNVSISEFQHSSVSRTEDFWALKDVSFEVKRGDVVGIIGRNGAGKSTLLKILSRITEPTEGRVHIKGRVASLLEVGTGFHNELTGRENIFLNGAILGMHRAEIKRKFDEIVAFSEVEKFLDMPVKRYSSGMYVRLAFAVAAHLEPEILIVDEVLAVGDAEFQKKCLGKMQDVAKGGRTVLFVSHNISAISTLCNKGILLRNGILVMAESANKTIEAYLSGFGQNHKFTSIPEHRPGSGEYRFQSAQASKETFDCKEIKIIKYQIKHYRGRVGRFFVSAHIVDVNRTIICQCDSRLMGAWFEDAAKIDGTFQLELPWLKPGTYTVDMFICSEGMVDQCENACHLEVSPILPYEHSTGKDAIQNGQVLAKFEWLTNKAND